MMKSNTAERETSTLDLTNSSSFLKPGAYITHNTAIDDITGGSSSDYMQLPLEPQKVL